MASSFWAPFFAEEMKGPSMFTPTTRAPPGTGLSMHALATSSAAWISSSPTVMVVGQKEVTPLVMRNFAMVSMASRVPSQVSAPAQPWMWISTKPGTMV